METSLLPRMSHPLHAVLRQELSWEGGRGACAGALLHGSVLCHHPVVLGNCLQL